MCQTADALYLDVRAAASLLGVSVPFVKKLTASGELPSAKLGRARRYRRADLEAFAEARTESRITSG